MKNKSNKKLFATSIAAATCGVLLLTGTFAWQSISQTAKNEVQGEVNPGGRLHDDFNGRNKDIYVENFMSTNEGGVPIIVRMRLYEYMEIGQDAGADSTLTPYGDSRDSASIPTTATLDSDPVTTWSLHKIDSTGNAVEETLHKYWSWSYGGQTTYMPTFNKNKDSLKADINGTWEGKTPGDLTHFDDYVVYTVGDSVSSDEIYDADKNTVDEDPGEVDINYTVVEDVKHTATVTLNAKVYTMEQWVNEGLGLGDFWVYDSDGWAYWANPLQPGTATGLLLDEINLTGSVSEKWYYSIFVDCQMVTADELDKDDKTGFYDDMVHANPSTEAESLLTLIVNEING